MIILIIMALASLLAWLLYIVLTYGTLFEYIYDIISPSEPEYGPPLALMQANPEYFLSFKLQ
jgi:hypothetical protein